MENPKPVKASIPSGQSVKKSTPSLNDIFKKKDETVVEQKVEQEESTSEENQEFTKEQLETEVKKYREQETVPRSVSTILQKPFELKDDTQIIIPITNPVEESMMKKAEAEFLEFLRDSLSNSAIEVTYELAAQEVTNRPYTNTERFQAMIKKNPALAKMRDDLGLDPDF